MRQIAILSADLINSSGISMEERKILYQKVQEAFTALEKLYDFTYERVKGDEYQLKTNKLTDILRVAILLKLWVKSISIGKKSYKPDIRISIGIGKVEIEESRLSESDGEAYTLSGRTLSSLKQNKKSFEIISHSTYKNEFILLSSFINYYFSSLTASQCLVLYYKVLNITETKIANLLNISQPTINRHAKSGDFNTLNELIQFFENLYHHEKHHPTTRNYNYSTN